MSLQERTLVVKNFDPDKMTASLLKELCIQAGPVRNVVVKPDHAFVEFEDLESVGYAKALLNGINLFDRNLVLEPKVRSDEHYKYSRILQDYVNYDKRQRAMQQQLQQQQMVALYQQQQQQLLVQHQHLPQQPITSTDSNLMFTNSSQMPTTLPSSQPDPQIFMIQNSNLGGQSSNQQSYFQSRPSTSSVPHNSDLPRSRGFNQPYNHKHDVGRQKFNYHGNRQYRQNDDWTKRRK